MNDLQTSLLLIGGAVIFIMIAWNIWQDRRARAQGGLPNVSEGQDPLLATHNRVEPSGQFNELVQKAFIENTQHVSLDRDLSTEYLEQLFAQIFVWFDPPQATDAMSDALAPLARIGGRPVHMHVTVSGEEDAGWVPLAHGQIITNLRLAIPLANRRGSVVESDYVVFESQVHQLADAFSSHLEMPDRDAVLSQAQRLDRMAANLDAMFGLHCVLPAESDLPSIEAELHAQGWVPEGRHWSKGLGAEHLASVVIHEAPGKRVLSFTLDLPNCCDPLKALNEIAEFGNLIATRFSGALMDDAGRTLTADSFVTIRTQMLERASALHEAGYSPGSPQARLLFA